MDRFRNSLPSSRQNQNQSMTLQIVDLSIIDGGGASALLQLKEQSFPNKEFKNLLAERTKDWEEYYKDDKTVINRFVWNALL